MYANKKCWKINMEKYPIHNTFKKKIPRVNLSMEVTDLCNENFADPEERH